LFKKGEEKASAPPGRRVRDIKGSAQISPRKGETSGKTYSAAGGKAVPLQLLGRGRAFQRLPQKKAGTLVQQRKTLKEKKGKKTHDEKLQTAGC